MSKRRRKNAERRSRRYLTAGFMAGAITVVLIIVISFGIGSFYSSAQEGPEAIKYYKSVQINKGDSLWSIAEVYMSDDYDSVYDYMTELVELNQLNDHEVDHLQEGDYLTVVYYDTEFVE